MLIPNNPENWLQQMVAECNHYPVHMVVKYLDPETSVCVDAGSNVGGFALSKWASYFKHMMAFDASEFNIAEYDKNVGDRTKFESYHYALSSNSGDTNKLMAYTYLILRPQPDHQHDENMNALVRAMSLHAFPLVDIS